MQAECQLIENVLKDVQKKCLNQGWTLSVAESCTGGTIASSITKIPGSSGYFIGGVIAYSNQVKIDLLNVRRNSLQENGAVSQQVVSEMATGVLFLTKSTFSLATSGIAGPNGGSIERPVGTVWVAIAKENQMPHCHVLSLKGNREEIIQQASLFCVNQLLKLINESS